ncbi:hypothetical protein PR048_001818 [Dryococelus australis]|uniref:Uncharacterized protein n=1 Tax=Dryococelus australis TaxID=614101 RepID=A0ABQ9IIL0_9NEOP|nr:hypothetical protein PR048_001818 [Dryococelus australis]
MYSVQSQALPSCSSTVGAVGPGGMMESKHCTWQYLPGTDHGIELGFDDNTTHSNRTTPAGTFFRGNYGNYLDTGTYI